MIGTEITISLIIVYVLQAASLPLQLLTQLKDGRSRSSDQLFILSLIFLGSNTLFLLYGYHLKDDFGAILGLKTLLIYAHLFFTISYLKHRISLMIELRTIHTFLFLLGTLIFSKSLLSDFILPSKLFQIKLVFTVVIQIMVAAFILRIVGRIKEVKGYSGLEEKMILLLLAMLSFAPTFFEIVGNHLIRFVIVNIIFFSLFVAHFIERSNKLKIESSPLSQLGSTQESEISEQEEIIEIQIDSNSLLKSYDLSSQQLIVLKLILQGKNYREVSVKLHIAHSTARKHGTNIYEKVGVSGLKSLRKKFKEIDLSNLPDY